MKLGRQRTFNTTATKTVASLPNVAAMSLRLRSDSGLYQDAGATIPAVADGDKVGLWQDQSGANNHVTAPTDEKRPTLKLAVANGHSALRFVNTTTRMATLADFPAAAQDDSISYFIITSNPGVGGAGTMLSHNGAWASGTMTGSLVANQNLLNFHGRIKNGTSIPIYQNWYTGQESNIGVIVVSHDVSIDRRMVNKIYYEVAPDGAAGFGAYKLFIGSMSATDSTDAFTGDILEIGFYDTPLTKSQMQQVQNYAVSKYSAKLSARQVVFAGDSLVASEAPISYPTYTANLYNSPSFYWKNKGIGGATIATMTTSFATNAFADQVVTYKTDTDTPAILPVWIGTNDIGGGRTSAQIINDLPIFHNARRALGWKTIVLTLIPRNADTAGMIVIRAAVNAWILANWATFADGLVDLNLIAELQDPTNTTYFIDGTHLTNAGNALVAAAVKPAIDVIA